MGAEVSSHCVRVFIVQGFWHKASVHSFSSSFFCKKECKCKRLSRLRPIWCANQFFFSEHLGTYRNLKGNTWQKETPTTKATPAGRFEHLRISPWIDFLMGGGLGVRTITQKHNSNGNCLITIVPGLIFHWPNLGASGKNLSKQPKIDLWGGPRCLSGSVRTPLSVGRDCTDLSRSRGRGEWGTPPPKEHPPAIEAWS